MRLLQNKTNVDPVSGTNPFGKERDNDGTGNGTPMNEELFGDTTQLIESIFAASGITANGLPDNTPNGFQLFDAFKLLTKPHTILVLNVSQAGTAAPTSTTLGFTDFSLSSPSWSRTAVGTYEYGFGAGQAGTAWQIVNNTDSVAEEIRVKLVGTALEVKTFVSGALSDDVLDNTSIEMRYYS